MISGSVTADGGQFAIDKTCFWTLSSAVSRPGVEPLFDGGRMRETGQAGIGTLERACVTADARCGAPFDPINGSY